MKIAVINGVNLNMLGTREKSIYGDMTLESINNKISKKYKNVEFEFFQSNNEGVIVDKIHSSISYDGIVLNAGAFTHYSIAIRDAIKCVENVETIEVHISNINSREEFRKNSVIADVCKGSISGFGEYSYILAVDYLVNGRKNEK